MAMVKAKCLISKTHDPFFNLATEDWIFNDLDPSTHVLFLWQNDRSVIIGRNQNPHAECDVPRITAERVNLVRRHSWGGTVFQDLGNMNFTFLSSKENYSRQLNFQIITNALKRFNILAETSGRNDLVVDGKKVSGSAFKETPNKAFHHGTLMMHVNLEELGDYLTPSKKKLMAKGTTSVRSRVANLKEFNSTINHQALSEAIIEEFFKTHNSQKIIEILDEHALKNIPQLMKYHALLKSHDWIHGETPEFTHHLEERLSWGGVDVHLNVKGNKIENAKIFSDALDVEMIHALEKSLNGVAYEKYSLTHSINNLKENLPHAENHLEEFSNWLVNQI